MVLFELTETQREIVEHIDGPILVTAGPGSGKTRVLIERIINLLRNDKKRILALTFSNKAAEEIKERIEKQVGADLQEQVYIGTIHGFCLDVVLNRGNLVGLHTGMVVFESESDKIEVLKRIFIEFPELKKEILKISNDDIYRLSLKYISEYKQQFISPESLKDTNIDNNTVFIKLYEAYNNMMISQRALDFDDILFYAYRIFTEIPKIANSYTRLYKYIFVDEAQDLNAAQYKIIKSLCNNFSNIMMVGDPAQSIYGFNGSNSDYMIKYFKKEFNPIEYKLVENFRSTRKIINAAKKLQVDTDSSAVYPLDGELTVNIFENEELEAEWITNKIRDLTYNGSAWVEGKLRYEDIAIIGRNRYVLSKVGDKLEESNIPYNYGMSLRGVESESKAIKIFETGIRIIINPFDNIHYNQILNLLDYNKGIKNKYETKDYLKVLLNIDINEISIEYQNCFKTIKSAWSILVKDEEKFLNALDIMHEGLVQEKLDTGVQNETIENEQYFIQKDIEMWREHWIKYCSKSVIGQRTLANFRNQVALGMTQSHSMEGVSLLTVHASKGLEYNIVFLIGLNEGTFPDYRSKNKDQLKDELNNMFVALTRSKRECYITYPKYKVMPWGAVKKQNPSRYIKAIGLK